MCLSVIIDRCSNFSVRYLFLYLNDIIYRYTMKRLRKMEEREDWNKRYFNVHLRLIKRILRYNRQMYSQWIYIYMRKINYRGKHKRLINEL